MITNQKLLLNRIVVQGENNIVSDMGGEKVMLSVSNGKYYNLGEMGGEIWEMIASPIEIEELIINLINQYDVERAQCEEQVLFFLELLYKENLIHLHE